MTFCLTSTRFSWLTNPLIWLSLETLRSIVRTGLPILVELIYLVNSIIDFLSQRTLLRRLTLLLGPLFVTLSVLLSWIFFFSDANVCSTMTLSIWELCSCCCVRFHRLSFILERDVPFNRISFDYLVLIGMVFVIIWEMFLGRTSLIMMILLLGNFVRKFRLELMYIINYVWSVIVKSGQASLIYMVFNCLRC